MSDLYTEASPRELIPGAPEELQSTASRLSAVADELAQAASQLQSVGAGAWKGTAADAFRGVMGAQPRAFRMAAESFSMASQAVAAYAGALEAAQGDASTAIGVFQEAESASAAWRRRRASGHGPVESTDPGEAGRARANQLLAAARDDAAAGAQRLATTLATAEGQAPKQPTLLERLRHDFARFARTHRNELNLVLFVKSLYDIQEKGGKVWEWFRWSEFNSVAREWRAVMPGLLGGEDAGGQLTLLAEAERLVDEELPTANHGWMLEHLSSLFEGSSGTLGTAARWLGTPTATAWFRGFGIAGSVVGFAIDANDLRHDYDHHAAGGKLAVDATGALFNLSTGAALLGLSLFPGAAPFIVGGAAILWGGAEVYEHWPSIEKHTTEAAAWVWDHSAPGILWHNRQEIGSVLDHGSDLASSVAGDIGHGVTNAWHSII